MPQRMRKIISRATGDDDTEGHAQRKLNRATGGDDDTEGHAQRKLNRSAGDDDTEGHAQRKLNRAAGDDDTEGHAQRKLNRAAGDDDTEGQSMLPNPLLNRQLASAREQEIQRNLRERQRADEAARRPYNKRGRA
jgi:hypothetical protein